MARRRHHAVFRFRGRGRSPPGGRRRTLPRDVAGGRCQCGLPHGAATAARRQLGHGTARRDSTTPPARRRPGRLAGHRHTRPGRAASRLSGRPHFAGQPSPAVNPGKALPAAAGPAGHLVHGRAALRSHHAGPAGRGRLWVGTGDHRGRSADFPPPFRRAPIPDSHRGFGYRRRGW